MAPKAGAIAHQVQKAIPAEAPDAISRNRSGMTPESPWVTRNEILALFDFFKSNYNRR